MRKKTKKIPFIGLQKPLVKVLGTKQQKKELRQYCIDNDIDTNLLD